MKPALRAGAVFGMPSWGWHRPRSGLIVWGFIVAVALAGGFIHSLESPSAAEHAKQEAQRCEEVLSGPTWDPLHETASLWLRAQFAARTALVKFGCFHSGDADHPVVDDLQRRFRQVPELPSWYAEAARRCAEQMEDDLKATKGRAHPLDAAGLRFEQCKEAILQRADRETAAAYQEIISRTGL